VTWPLAALASLWAFLAGLSPTDATRIAAHITGLERYEDEAQAIVRSESRGVAVGVHGDAGRVHGLVFYRAAVKAGLIHLGECEYHVPGDDGAAGWGIRGAHGNAAAYGVHHLGDCIAPAALDVPYLSAVITLRRLAELERRHGFKDAEGRALAWRVGVGAAKRSRVASAHGHPRTAVR
jgi:hypothetical protein